MIKLRKYIPQDANYIIKWIKNEKEFYLWSADRYSKYPITAYDVNTFYDKYGKDFYIFTAIDEYNRVVGHFILRYPNTNDKSIVRLGFVIIDNTLRSKGIGKEMLALAIKYAADVLLAKTLTLGVFENNPSAYYCYKSCGFIEIGEISQYNCNGELWNCIEMQTNLKI